MSGSPIYKSLDELGAVVSLSQILYEINYYLCDLFTYLGKILRNCCFKRIIDRISLIEEFELRFSKVLFKFDYTIFISYDRLTSALPFSRAFCWRRSVFKVPSHLYTLYVDYAN